MADEVKTVPGYKDLARHLKSAAVDVGVSEVHGLLRGLLCAGMPDASTHWRRELFSDEEPRERAAMACLGSLDRLSLITRAHLEDPQAGFALLLPDDEQPLGQRALALAEWCQGFLYGLGLCGVSRFAFSEETREALRDLAEITGMDQHNLQESEDNEEAYMEICEFVRVAALLVRENLLAGPEQAP